MTLSFNILFLFLFSLLFITFLSPLQTFSFFYTFTLSILICVIDIVNRCWKLFKTVDHQVLIKKKRERIKWWNYPFLYEKSSKKDQILSLFSEFHFKLTFLWIYVSYVSARVIFSSTKVTVGRAISTKLDSSPSKHFT